MQYTIKGQSGKKTLEAGKAVAVDVEALARLPRMPKSDLDLLKTYVGKRPIYFSGVDQRGYRFRIETRGAHPDHMIFLEERDVYVAISQAA